MVNNDYYNEEEISSDEVVSVSSPNQEDALQIINSSHEVILRLSYEEYALIKQWQLAQAKAWKAANDLARESKEMGLE